MITCPECGADNLIGPIFCRTCGGKLNLDELKPESFVQKQDSLAKKLGQMLQRALVLVIVVGLFGGLIAFFLPADAQTFPPDEAAMTKASARFERMKKAQSGTFAFSLEEVNALLNQTFGLGGMGNAPTGGTMVPEQIKVESLGGQNARVILKTRVFGKAPAYCIVEGRFDVDDLGLSFIPRSTKTGKLPMVANLQDLVLRQFTALLQGQEGLDHVQKTTKSLEIDDNTATFVF